MQKYTKKTTYCEKNGPIGKKRTLNADYKPVVKTVKIQQKSPKIAFCNLLILNTKHLPKFTQIPTKFLPKPTTVDFAIIFINRRQI
jgi:hypothetical protein